MNTRLPDPPSSVAYMTQLVRAIERELDRRAVLVEGAIVVSDEQPLRIMGPTRETYTVGVDSSGSLTLTPDD